VAEVVLKEALPETLVLLVVQAVVVELLLLEQILWLAVLVTLHLLARHKVIAVGKAKQMQVHTVMAVVEAVLLKLAELEQKQVIQ
jgi:hypothetical protein